MQNTIEFLIRDEGFGGLLSVSRCLQILKILKMILNRILGSSIAMIYLMYTAKAKSNPS